MVLSFSPLRNQIVSYNAGNQPESVNCAGLQQGRLTFALGMDLKTAQLLPLIAGGKGHNNTLQFLPSKSGNSKDVQDVTKNGYVYCDSLDEWLQINRNCSFYSVSFNDWHIQPIIYYKPIYSTTENSNDWEFWFSNGTTVFTYWVNYSQRW